MITLTATFLIVPAGTMSRRKQTIIQAAGA
jgi:hypothetical protein